MYIVRMSRKLEHILNTVDAHLDLPGGHRTVIQVSREHSFHEEHDIALCIWGIHSPTHFFISFNSFYGEWIFVWQIYIHTENKAVMPT